jgi:hypothetical protein
MVHRTTPQHNDSTLVCHGFAKRFGPWEVNFPKRSNTPPEVLHVAGKMDGQQLNVLTRGSLSGRFSGGMEMGLVISYSVDYEI